MERLSESKWLAAQGGVKTEEVAPEAAADRDVKGGISVSARTKWTNTGVQVKHGDVVVIRYKSGLWSVNPDHGSWYDAEGAKGFIAHQGGYVMTGVAEGSLCGRIGNSGPAFYIGNTGRIVSDRSGTLHLIANDDILSAHGVGYDDNQGSIKVDID